MDLPAALIRVRTGARNWCAISASGISKAGHRVCYRGFSMWVGWRDGVL